MSRGMLTKEINKKAISFLGREITTDELRLYPFMDYMFKNNFNMEKDILKLNKKEIEILERLDDEKHIEFNRFQNIPIKPTKEFYDFLQQILWISYCEELHM